MRVASSNSVKVENSNIKDRLENIHISEYGVYFFYKDFVIGEIHQGVIYNWNSAQSVINAVYEHYGDNPRICYITNRINKYSINPTHWLKFFATKNKLNGYAIVNYTEKSWVNSLIEKLFLKTKVKQFSNLADAIEWTKEINLRSLPVAVSPL